MASNASSSSHHPITNYEYDVFVSFRGETRKNFTGFLFQALEKNGIETFKDDQHIKKGESISPSLMRAIEGSRVFVVVFSKDYASSTWCLRELAYICKCIQTSPRPLLPVFFDVDPSDVRKQSGDYKKAFAEYEKRFREDKEKMEEVKIWREVLTRVASVSGWDTRDKQQNAEVEKIVQEITNKLGSKFLTLPNDNLFGMKSRLEELTELLHLELVNDIRVIGISGMGGIGKSTLGRALYERISHIFHSCCYIDDVSKVYRDSQTLGVQKQLLSQSLNEKNLEIDNVSHGTLLTWTRLCNARALIVLDNVDQVGQLEMFSGNRDTMLRERLGRGSRIIIISRDQQILKAHGVDAVYQVKPLNGEDAVYLFCRKAFKSNYIMSHFEKLTCDVLSHCQGHPLAIKVLGSSLFDKDVSHWRSALASLRENKSRSIMNVLQISFDQLEETHKEIFLDIACFFNGHPMEYVKEVLDFRGFYPVHGLQVLVDKSLITMTWKIEMHGLLSDLGKYIVREKSPKEPWKWSRLWDYKDLHKVTSCNKAAENVEAIVIQNIRNFPQTTMRVDALSTMSHLKLLDLKKISYFSLKVNFPGRLDNLSNELGYLNWINYPFDCLPPSFEPDKLVQLILSRSNIKQLWEGTKPLHNLRVLDLSHSKNLIKMPDMGDALNLERLDLEGCIQLEEIGLSIVLSRKLTFMNLKDCESLIKLPQFGEALILEELDLEGCKQLRQIDPSIGRLKKLTHLHLKNCKNLVSLPNSILGLNSLKYLNLSGCSKLCNTQLLYELTDAKHLKKIDLDGAPIHFQSTSSYSREHKNSVSCLLSSSPIFPWMWNLDLSFCNLVQIPDAIGTLGCLERLDLSGNNFATLPNLKELSKLYCLKLQHCKQLKYLPELPSRIDFSTDKRYALRDAGLYIFNCPELVDRERCTNMGLSWMIQISQVRNKVGRLWNSAGNVTPGSEIPWWFNNQHVGNCVRLDASPVMHDNNWVGIAFCAIFVVPQETVLAMGPPSKIKGYFRRFGDMPVDFYGDLDLEIELVSDESDHTWLFFVDREEFIEKCHLQRRYLGRLNWTFKEWKDPDFHAEVKKYGYRWIYKHDLELSNPLARKRKFWAIEQNDERNQRKRSKARISAKWGKDAAKPSMENTIKLLENQFANLGL